MQPTTRSESTQKLVNICLDAAAGRCSTAVAEAAVSERERGLATNAAAFEQKLDGESAAFRAQVEAAGRDARQAFHRYGEALRLVRQWLSSGDATVLERVLERLATAGDGILDALASWDMAVMTARGPTDHPILNTLIRACETPSVEPAFLGPLVAQVRQLLSQVERHPRGSHPLVERLRAGAPDYIEALDDLDRFAAGGTRDDLERGVTRLRGVAGTLANGADLLVAGARATGPTRFPLANAIINSVDALGDGRVPVVLLEELLTTLETASARMRGGLSAALRPGDRSATLVEQAEHTRAALALHDQALADLRRFVTEGDVAALARGADALREAVLALERGKKVYDDVAAREGKVVCVWCNKPNEPRNHSCVGCGRLLPRWNDEEHTGSTFSVSEGGEVRFQEGEAATEHIEALAAVLEAAAAGEVSQHELTAHFDAFEGRLQAGEARLSYRGGEITTQAREAIAVMRDGLQALRVWQIDGDAEHLEAGMEAVRLGAVLLYQAQQAARAQG